MQREGKPHTASHYVRFLLSLDNLTIPLAHIDPLRTTPIDALLLVSELKQLAEGSEEE